MKYNPLSDFDFIVSIAEKAIDNGLVNSKDAREFNVAATALKEYLESKKVVFSELADPIKLR